MRSAIALGIVLALLASVPAAAQPNPLVIHSATPDRSANSLTIRGANFGSSPSQVFLETTMLTVLNWTDSEIVVTLPAAIADGSYLLTVAKGAHRNDSDIFNVSVSTPVPGPPGPAGAAGVSGLEVVSALTPPAPINIAGFGLLVASATCPPGKRVISGGHESLGNAVLLQPIQTGPTDAATWTVTLRNPFSGAQSNMQARVFAVCALAP